ncbi:MAG: Nif3-like dinuclear metal center hexameric protein [Ruminococcaceae bacterium]|nr:Nif3-like dinuclear metal center hexameric protein [Oscillospiraceae bacterium]
MKVIDLYSFLNEKIPPSLSCPWDNDGLLCCPDTDAEVHRVLIALDITDRVIDAAIEGGYNVIVAHHPMIFSPLKALDPRDHVAKKAIRLITAGITAMCFHTRLDAVQGGVNDTLADLLALRNIAPFGNPGEEIGRIGDLPQAMPLADFCALVRRVTGAPSVQVSDAGKTVQRVAVLGGSGSDDVFAAIAAGADTFLSGELKHNYLTEAPECGINLVAAGHFYTENPICKTLAAWIGEAFPALTVQLTDSNPVRVW